eukprot:TRINITY_DN11631_c0_g1_i1.p4 TRINITY_DN11631_c0_g1~~TRINITY_DN11631_c0_g1_i1.p4  ORF type:complete len:110 (+),score=1.58 TRINITY_DN11631_c0_g1_i1:416-745(+)
MVMLKENHFYEKLQNQQTYGFYYRHHTHDRENKINCTIGRIACQVLNKVSYYLFSYFLFSSFYVQLENFLEIDRRIRSIIIRSCGDLCKMLQLLLLSNKIVFLSVQKFA